MFQVIAEANCRADARRDPSDRPSGRELARPFPPRRRTLRTPRRLFARIVDFAVEERRLHDGSGERSLPCEVRRKDLIRAVGIPDEQNRAKAVSAHSMNRPWFHTRPPRADRFGTEDIFRPRRLVHEPRDVIGGIMPPLPQRRIPGQQSVFCDRESVYKRAEHAPARNIPPRLSDFPVVCVCFHGNCRVGLFGPACRIRRDELHILPGVFANLRRPRGRRLRRQRVRRRCQKRANGEKDGCDRENQRCAHILFIK